MSSSFKIKGVRDLDGKFRDMMRVKLACDAANVSYPPEVRNYFGEETVKQSEAYLRMRMEFVDIDEFVSESTKEDGEYHLRVDIEDLPNDVAYVAVIVTDCRG